MSTFAQLADLPGVGVNYLLEVSQDRFVSVTYAYSVTSMNFGGTNYEGRIVEMGRLQRGFGVDGLYAAGTVSLRLDNTDGLLDWLTSPSSVEVTVLRSRFRLSIVLFDPADPTDAQSKVLGVFTCLDFPKRDDSTVTLSLADDALGDAAELAIAPTYGEWIATTSYGAPLEFVVDASRPVQLMFGAGIQAEPLPAVRPVKGSGGGTTRPLALYATTQTDAAGAVPPWFWAVYLHTASGFVISPNPGNTSGAFLFEMKTSGPIVKDGKGWYIHWVQLNVDEWWKDAAFAAHLASLNVSPPRTVGAGGNVINYSGSPPDDILDAVGPIKVNCWPGSSRSFQPISTASTYDGWGFFAHGSDVVFDLLVHYSKVPVADVVTATFDDVRAAWPGAKVRGVISDGDRTSRIEGQDRALFQAGRLRGVLRDVCRSSGIDLYAGWDGKLRVSGATATYAAAVAGFAGTLPRIEETRCLEGSVSMKIPSAGERWAPFNRLFLTDPEGRLFGPYDNQQAITSWGRVVPKTIDAKWADWFLSSAGLAFSTGNTGWAGAAGVLPIESKVRPVVTFQYPLAALALDLADYFVMSVTRGNNTAFQDSYVDAIWRVEAITLLPLTGYVEVTAVWSSDLITETAYLLDDEAEQFVTSQAGHGGNPSVTTGSNIVTFSGGNLNTAGGGVFVGDILVLQDATEGATSFLRNRGLFISSIDSATQLKFSTSESNVFGGAGIAVATWKIIRGKGLLGTTGSYPDGTSMYGANVENGVYSFAGPGNRFKAG